MNVNLYGNIRVVATIRAGRVTESFGILGMFDPIVGTSVVYANIFDQGTYRQLLYQLAYLPVFIFLTLMSQ